MEIKKINVRDAVGTVLAHDITRIIPGKCKGPAFTKGHIVERKDIKKLLEIGKEHLWSIKLSKNEYHENTAAVKFKSFAGENIVCGGPSEGKLTFSAACDGLLTVQRRTVDDINRIKNIVFTTRHSQIPVKKGDVLAGIRIIPLAINAASVRKAVSIRKKTKALRVHPFLKKKIGIIVTGSEVAKGRIKDKFRPIIEKKLKNYGGKLVSSAIITDSRRLIKNKILTMSKSCDIIIITGGMSVDPDDVTRYAIQDAGAKIVSYGAPVLPGNMFLVSYLGDTPILGIPACGLFYKTTVFDLFLPIAMAGLKLTKSDILLRGYGGLCAGCEVCRYPVCPFGKC